LTNTNVQSTQEVIKYTKYIVECSYLNVQL